MRDAHREGDEVQVAIRNKRTGTMTFYDAVVVDAEDERDLGRALGNVYVELGASERPVRLELECKEVEPLPEMARIAAAEVQKRVTRANG